MLIFFLTIICTAEDAAALAAFIINISGRCCTAANDTNCAADGCSELDHQHKKHKTSLRSTHTQHRAHRGMAKHFLLWAAVLISHLKKILQCIFFIQHGHRFKISTEQTQRGKHIWTGRVHVKIPLQALPQPGVQGFKVSLCREGTFGWKINSAEMFR